MLTPDLSTELSRFAIGFDHRDRALLTVTIAAGFASTIFMPIEAWLVTRLGWRTALLVLAVVLSVWLLFYGVMEITLACRIRSVGQQAAIHAVHAA